jgi:hypothetical protein
MPPLKDMTVGAGAAAGAFVDDGAEVAGAGAAAAATTGFGVGAGAEGVSSGSGSALDGLVTRMRLGATA